MFGGPLALTSANLSSQASSLNVEVRDTQFPRPRNVTRPNTVFSEPAGLRFAGIARQKSLVVGTLPIWQGLG